MRHNDSRASAAAPPGASARPGHAARFPGAAATQPDCDPGLLSMLKARLEIFLYRHPVGGIESVIDVIDNAESTGEIQMLLDYVLARRLDLRAA
jgi:hypothetical protein